MEHNKSKQNMSEQACFSAWLKENTRIKDEDEEEEEELAFICSPEIPEL